MTARSDRDLTPESIVQKVSDASGSKYSGSSTHTSAAGPPPPSFSKPAFTPTQHSAGGGGFNPLSSRARLGSAKDANVDEDGWGADAPPVTRTQLEKVQSSYQPTKVNLRSLDPQNSESPISTGSPAFKPPIDSDVVKGGYQPVGKVDIAALRKQSQHRDSDDRPTSIKGAYEPIGKVDIAAIRARAQPPSDGAASTPTHFPIQSTSSPAQNSEAQRTLPERSAPFSTSERLTSLPRPKVSNKFGSNAGSFTGTKAPTPGNMGLESSIKPSAPPVGVGRTFADQGGKTPAQLWAEKKARERGSSLTSDNVFPAAAAQTASPMASQDSGGGEWKSDYGGKSWAPVQTTRTGQSSGNMSELRTGTHEEDQEDYKGSPAGGVSAIRDKFRNSAPIRAANANDAGNAPSPPALDTSNKPNAGRGIPIPGLSAQPSRTSEDEQDAPRMPSPPLQPPRSPTPPTPPASSSSPIRVAMPISRGHNDLEVENARDEQLSPPPAMPARSLAQAIPHEDDLTDEPLGHDPARGAGEAAAASSFGGEAVGGARPGGQQSGKRAVVQYDYEKAEANELELKEGEHVTGIEMVDENWWMAQNQHGETGLFPSNYVEIIEEDEQSVPEREEHLSSQHAEPARGATATALYDYEAAEDNELSFPENATISGVVSHYLLEARLQSDRYNRNFLMTIGGLVSMPGNQGCSRPIT